MKNFATSLLVIAALFAGETNAIYLAKKTDGPPPTAADAPTSGYYGADEDDVMNNIFNHYAVETTDPTGTTRDPTVRQLTCPQPPQTPSS
jgi:hypothetical protein